MRRILAILLVVHVLALLFGARITILHVNDTHGRAWTTSDLGGFAVIATIVESVRKEVESSGGYVLFLHAGDLNTGVPESDLLDAMPDILALNMIGLDAMAVGNHEFDKPREVLLRQMKLAEFKFLSANIVDSEGKPFFTPYLVKQLGDVRVAIVGFTTEETEILEPLYLEGLRFKNVIEVARELVPRVREESDIVIALVHLDWGTPTRRNVTTTHQLAAVEGIDVIIAGHSHTKLEKAEVVNGTILVQAWEHGKYVGRLDLEVENGKIVNWSWKPIPVDPKVYPEDRQISKVLAFFKKLGDEKLDTTIGETKILLDGERENVRSKSTNLSNLIADAMRWKVGADIAFTNGGGIRASIKPGVIKIRDILTVLPFGNTLYVLEMKGKDVLKVLEYAATVEPGKGAFLQVSGLKWKSKGGKVTEVFVNGEPLDPEGTYKVVTNNYMAQGGDGYTMFAGLPGYDTGFLMADAVVEYIQKVLKGVVEDYDSSQRYVRE